MMIWTIMLVMTISSRKMHSEVNVQAQKYHVTIKAFSETVYNQICMKDKSFPSKNSEFVPVISFRYLTTCLSWDIGEHREIGVKYVLAATSLWLLKSRIESDIG